MSDVTQNPTLQGLALGFLVALSPKLLSLVQTGVDRVKLANRERKKRVDLIEALTERIDKDHAQYEADRTDFREQLRLAKKESADAKELASTAQITADGAKDELVELREQLNAVMDESKGKDTVITSQKDIITQQVDTIAVRDTRIKELDDALAQERTDHAMTKTERDALKAERDRLQRERDELQAQLDALIAAREAAVTSQVDAAPLPVAVVAPPSAGTPDAGTGSSTEPSKE